MKQEDKGMDELITDDEGRDILINIVLVIIFLLFMIFIYPIIDYHIMRFGDWYYEFLKSNNIIGELE